MSLPQKPSCDKISIYEAMLDKAKCEGNTRHIKRVLQILSILYHRESLHKKSVNCLLELLPIIEKTESPGCFAYYHRMAAKSMILAMDYITAEEYLKRSLDIYENLGDLLGKANVYISYGEIYRKKGLMDQCATYLADALNILNSFNEQLQTSNSISFQTSYDTATEAVGRILVSMKLFDEANDIMSKLLDRKKVSSNKTDLTRIIQNLGAANCHSHPDKALLYLKEAQDYAISTENYYAYSAILSNMGLCYETKGEYNNAIRLYKKSCEIMTEYGLTNHYPNVLNNLASSYLKIGDTAEAKHHAYKSLELPEHDEKLRDNQTSFWVLSESYKAEKNYKKAYDYLLKYCEINDEMFNADIANKLNLLQKDYEATSSCLTEIKKQFSLISDALKKTIDMNFIGVSAKINKVYRSAIQASEHPRTNVIVTGESGVGKEIVARLVHFAGSGNKGPFIDVNCSAIVETLAESEFFGHTKGSFTGANYDKPGFIEAANGGTLFLDEIADTPLPIQAKFLRVLETRTLKRIGSNKTVKVDFRLVSATNKDIGELVSKGLFREDLLYRINTIGIHIPPLRERKDDIAPLVDHFLKEFARKMNKPIPNYSKALEQLHDYHFPGNVRELKNIIERAMIMLDGNELRLGDLDSFHRSAADKRPNADKIISMKQMELDLIEKALQKCGGSYTKASIMLGISYSTIRRKAKSLSQKD